MRGLPQARRRRRRLTIRAKTSSPPPRPRPAARAPMLSSTWWAATTSSATTRPPRSKGASCRSPSRARPRRPSISAASCSSACTHTGSTLRARSVADKGAIARAVEEHVLPLIAAGTVKPVMDSTFPAGGGRGRPCPHGSERPYRQDRPDRLELYCAQPWRAQATSAGRAEARKRPRNRRNVDCQCPLHGVAQRPAARPFGMGSAGRASFECSSASQACWRSGCGLRAAAGAPPAGRGRGGQRAAATPPPSTSPPRSSATAPRPTASWSRPRPGPTASSSAWTCARARATPTGRCSRWPIPATSRSTA